MSDVSPLPGMEPVGNPERLFNRSEIRPVADFRSNYGNGFPHDYPGERPETSFLADTHDALGAEEAMVYPMRVVPGEQLAVEVKTPFGVVDVDAVLEDLGLPKMEDRIPVLAYGANVCPKAMTKKLNLEEVPEAGLVPTIYATMKGYEVVWHEKPGMKGNAIAVLYKGPETEAAAPQVAVNFLTPAQLLLLHKTETFYDFGHVGEVELEGGAVIPALMYAGSDSIVLKDGRPIAVEGVRRSIEVLPAMNSRDAVDFMLSAPGVRDELMTLDPQLGAVDANEFAALIRTKSAPGKREIQKIIKHHQDKAPVSMADPNYSGLKTVSWSNPNTLPTFAQLTGKPRAGEEVILLPEQVLEGATPEEMRKVRKALSIHFARVIKPSL